MAYGRGLYDMFEIRCLECRPMPCSSTDAYVLDEGNQYSLSHHVAEIVAYLGLPPGSLSGS